MYCKQCKKEVKPEYRKEVDCPACIGTGIGHIRADTKCGKCKGRGYLIVEPFLVCSECETIFEATAFLISKDAYGKDSNKI